MSARISQASISSIKEQIYFDLEERLKEERHRNDTAREGLDITLNQLRKTIKRLKEKPEYYPEFDLDTLGEDMKRELEQYYEEFQIFLELDELGNEIESLWEERGKYCTESEILEVSYELDELYGEIEALQEKDDIYYTDQEFLELTSYEDQIRKKLLISKRQIEEYLKIIDRTVEDCNRLNEERDKINTAEGEDLVKRREELNNFELVVTVLWVLLWLYISMWMYKQSGWLLIFIRFFALCFLRRWAN